MTTQIMKKIDADDNRVLVYTLRLKEFGIKTRQTNAYLISGKNGKNLRLRVKLDRKNIPELSDKIRDVHQLLAAIDISVKTCVSLQKIVQEMDKSKENPFEVHHNNHLLIYNVKVLTKQQHDNLHRQSVLKGGV